MGSTGGGNVQGSIFVTATQYGTGAGDNTDLFETDFGRRLLEASLSSLGGVAPKILSISKGVPRRHLQSDDIGICFCEISRAPEGVPILQENVTIAQINVELAERRVERRERNLANNITTLDDDGIFGILVPNAPVVPPEDNDQRKERVTRTIIILVVVDVVVVAALFFYARRKDEGEDESTKTPTEEHQIAENADN